MEWIRAHWTPGQPDVAPTRVLVAGCGTGAEAFAHSRRFPNAEIVAVDFSARALALAREYQQRERYRRNVRFVMADLSAPGLDWLTGGDFDLVSCHGVVSYVPRAGRALQNVAGCLAADGALVLGVNGVGHVSAGVRAALPLFGFDVARFTEGPAVREALALFDALLGHTRRSDRIASRPADYVASDIFGALNQSLPLPAWVRTARAAGLHLQNSWSAHRTLRLAVERGVCERLLPRSRARVCELIDSLRPAPFHMLLFTRRPLVDPPWRTPKALRDWRPQLTGLFSLKRLPSGAGSSLAPVTIDSRAINTRIQWPMARWQRALLRDANGRRSIGEILGRAASTIAPGDPATFLYVLHQLVVLDLQPPPPSEP